MASVREIARLMVKLEASGVTQTAAAVLAVDDAGRRASKSTDGLDRSFRNAKSSASGAGDEVSKVARSMDDASRAARANATATSTQSDAQNELYGHLDRNMRQLSRMSEENRRAAFAASDLGDRTTTLTKDVDHAGDSLRAASTHVRRFGDDSDDSGRRLRGLSRVLANFGGRGLGGDFSKLTASLGPLRGGIGALVIITATLGPVLLAAAGSTIALVSALGPLVGLGPAAAVGLGALAQAAGVVALAFAGVGDALKEQLDVQDKAAKLSLSNADQQRSAARAIQAAQDGVRAANERVTRAGEDLAKAEKAQTDATKALAVARQQAKRDLQDMHASLANASLTEKRATLDLADARAALAKALAPADVSRLADAQAELTNSTLSEQRAVMSLADARQRLEDLMKPADALTLADAQDAVADAARGETRAALALADARKKAEGVLASASSTDEDKARAKLDLADAENAIGDASRASAKAQQQLQKLQAGPDPKEVAKAKFDVAAAEQAVADAQRNTAKSSAAVNDAMKGANPAEVARATLDVASAEQALADAQRARARLQKDIAAADKAGVKGAAAMVQARRQLAQANDQVTDAERGVVEAQRAATRATEALRDAQVSAASSTAKAGLAAQALNEKFDALPPAAQAFVRKLVELKPKLDELRAIAAAGLFPGVIKGIEAAQGAFEPLKRVVGETAGTLSGLTERAGELVGSKGFGKDLETIGHRNALVLDRTGRATFYLAGAMKDLIVAAGPLTTWLAKATLEWARNVKASTQAGRESGRLADFFQRTKNTLQLVGSVLGNLAGAFYAVGKSAAPFGRDILHSLDAVTGRFETWAKSTKGQKSLTDFFRQSNELMGSLMPVLGEVSKSFVGLTFRVFPAYVKILEALGPLAGPLIHAYVTWKVAATGVAIATGLVTAATKAWTAAQWLLNAALTANPIGIVVTAIAALVAGFIVAYKKSETFRDIVNGALNAVKDAAVAVFGWIKVNWPLLLGILAGPFGLLVIEIVKHWGAIKDLAASLPGTVAGAIKTGASTLVNAGKWVLDQIIGGFKAVASGITGAASWLFGKLKGGLDALADVFGNRGKDVLAWIIGGFKAVTSGIASAGKWVLDTLKSVLDGLAGNFVNRGKDIIGWIVDGLTFVSDKGISAVSGVGEWLLKQLKHMLDSIKDGVEGLGGTVMDWIIGGLKKGAFELQGFLNKIIHVINKIPGVDIKDINVLKKDKNGDVTGFARGGAYGRTGGLVSAPITLMGEEAPRWPEFVVPTNPAYRKRAQGLAMQAAKAVGLARGGIYSQGEIEDLWVAAKGPEGQRRIAGAVGMAESGGDTHAVGPETPWGRAKGLMQILGQVVPGDLFDPLVNMRNAVKKFLDAGGWSPWEAFTGPDGVGSDGPYLKFLNGGGGILGKIGSAISGAAGSVADMVKGLVGKLPGTDGLDWLADTGKYVLGKVKDWIKSKVGGLFGGASTNPISPGVSGSIEDAIKVAMGLGFARPSTNQLTGGKHTPTSYHYQGRAADFGAAGHSVAEMTGLFNALLGKYGSHLKELFYDPVGYYVKNGAKVSGAIGGHSDHLHVALAKGGMFGGLPYLGTYHDGGVAPREGIAHVAAGERMTPAGQAGGVHIHGDLVVREEADVELLARKLAFRLN